MRVIRTPEELRPGNRRVCLAMGFFDGVHLGHQQIIRQTISDARRQDGVSLVLTFDRHPRAVLAPDRVPPLIYRLSRKLEVIRDLGVEALLLLPFDEALCRLPGETFIRNLARGLGTVQSICVGSNFVFGHLRGGNVELLRRLGEELHFTVHGVASLALDGHAISSTRIRAALHAGSLDLASQMLGRPYSLAAPVVKGDALGRQLGFPTANLDCAGLVLPPSGVYAGEALVDGHRHRAVLNIGHRPTLASARPVLRVEVHLLDFAGDLYGRELEVIPGQRLREERKFPSLEELKRQIARDIEQARQLFPP